MHPEYRKYLKKVQFFLKFFVRVLSRLVKKNNNIIIFCSDRYNENSRYLFEYMASNRIKSVFWLVYDKRIKEYLESKGYPCISNPVEHIYYLMRAKVVITSGNEFWDRYGAVSYPTIQYCLTHGCGPKVTEYYNDFTKSINVLKAYNSFDYINFPNEYSANLIGRCIYKLPQKKIVVNGYPRTDHLFKSTLDDYYKTRKELEEVLGVEINSKIKLVLYTPTFRKYDVKYSFPIKDLESFSSESFNKFLIDENILIVYSKHPQTDMHNLGSIKNIIPLDYELLPTFDLSYYLPAFDALINDYSTTSVDYSILNRKQLFVMPDYKKYLHNDAFLENYDNDLPGEFVKSFPALIEQLQSIIVYPDCDISGGGFRDKHLFRKYWESKSLDSCKRHSDFLEDITR